MEIDHSLPVLFRGKIGDLIYYVRNGKQYVRRASIEGKKRKNQDENCASEQKQRSNRFSYIQKFYAYYRKNISDQIWRVVAKKEKRQADNLFHQINAGCFIGDGQLVNFEKFCFSYGWLWLPWEMTLEKVDDRYRVGWKENRVGERTDPNDRLMVGLIYDGKPGAPCLATEVSGCRKDMEGWFTLPKADRGAVHVYCFFGREDETAFSESRYFKIQDNSEIG